MSKIIKLSAIVVAGIVGVTASAGALAHNPYRYYDGARHQIVHHDRKAIRHIKRKQNRIYNRHLARAIRADLNGRPGKADRIMRKANHKVRRLNNVKRAYHRDIRHAKNRYY